MSAMTQPILLDGGSDFGGEHDFYETPAYAVEVLLPLLRRPLREDGQTRWHVIEPCAGRGAILDVVVPELAPAAVTAWEIDPGRYSELELNWRLVADCGRCDFLRATAESIRVGLGPNLWITNPPYSKPRKGIGLDILEHALELSGPRDCVAFLMQLDVATGVGPTERIHDRWPGSLYPLKRRPTFSGDGVSGKRPFAWFVFDRLNPTREWRPIG